MGYLSGSFMKKGRVDTGTEWDRDGATRHCLTIPMVTGESALSAYQAVPVLGEAQDPRRKPFPNLEAALGRGSHPTCPASGDSALRQDARKPGTKNGSCVATGPELLLLGSYLTHHTQETTAGDF